MANRYFTQFPKVLEKEKVSLFAHVTFGAAGAPTLDTANSKGIKSISRTSAGLYVVTFGVNAVSAFGSNVDKYVKFLMARHVFLNATAPASPGMFVPAQAVAASGTITLQFNAAGVATDPGSGEQVYLEIELGNSSAI